jgi:hypothetical protein
LLLVAGPMVHTSFVLRYQLLLRTLPLLPLLPAARLPLLLVEAALPPLLPPLLCCRALQKGQEQHGTQYDSHGAVMVMGP